MLLCDVLAVSDGVLWSAVRGNGLAYGVDVSFVSLDRQISVGLSECTHPAKVCVCLCVFFVWCVSLCFANGHNGAV